MKILARVFIIVGVISFLFALIISFNSLIAPPSDFEDWWIIGKIESFRRTLLTGTWIFISNLGFSKMLVSYAKT